MMTTGSYLLLAIAIVKKFTATADGVTTGRKLPIAIEIV